MLQLVKHAEPGSSTRTYNISLQGPALSDKNSWFPLMIMVARATIVCGNTGMPGNRAVAGVT